MYNSNVFRLPFAREPFFSSDYAARRAIAIEQIDTCINGCVELLGVVHDRRLALDLKIDGAIVAEILAALSRLDVAVGEMKDKKL